MPTSAWEQMKQDFEAVVVMSPTASQEATERLRLYRRAPRLKRVKVRPQPGMWSYGSYDVRLLVDSFGPATWTAGVVVQIGTESARADALAYRDARRIARGCSGLGHPCKQKRRPEEEPQSGSTSRSPSNPKPSALNPKP